MIGIISYLPETSELRQHRISCLNSVIEYWHTVLPNETIHIVAQCFTDIDIDCVLNSTLCNIEFIRVEYGLGPAKARNILLKLFYSSNDKWLVLSDDDVILYDYYEHDKLFYNIYTGVYDKYNMDIVLTVSPQLRPFKEKLLKLDVSNYHLFTPSTLSDIPNILLLRNTGTKIYYDENMLNSKIPEDAHFLIQAMLNKLNVVTCLNLIKKDLALYKSTLCEDETAKDTYWHKQLSNNLRQYVNDTYGVKMSMFSRKYNIAKPFRIKRDVMYVIPDRLATIKRRPKCVKKNTIHKLF